MGMSIRGVLVCIGTRGTCASKVLGIEGLPAIPVLTMGPKVGIRGVPEPEAVTRGWGGMAETDGTDEGPAAGATV